MSRNNTNNSNKSFIGQMNPINAIPANYNVEDKKEQDKSIQHSAQNLCENECMEEEAMSQGNEQTLGIKFRIEISYENNPD